MSTIFNCPSCLKQISANVEPGADVQCPLCGEIVVVPESEATAPPQPPLKPVTTTPLRYATTATIQMQPRQGMAIGSLVCGVLSMLGCFLFGVGGIILGSIGLILGIISVRREKRDPDRYTGRSMAIGGIVTGSLGLLMGLAMTGLMIYGGILGAKFVECDGRVQRINQALHMSAAANNDNFPADLNDLVRDGYLTADQLVCPMTDGSQTSYYYVPGYSTQSDPKQIILIERPNNHATLGGHVLLVDGTVTILDNLELQNTLQNLTLPDGTPFQP